MIRKNCVCAMFVAMGLATANTEAQAQWYYFEPAPQPVVVQPVARHLAIDIRNDSNEPISLSVRGVHVTDIPVGGRARVRAIEGKVEMEAFKQNSRVSVRQTIYENRDFIWTVPLRQRVIRNPALVPDAYLESVTLAPAEVPQAARAKTPELAPAAVPKLGDEQVVRSRATNSGWTSSGDPRRIPLQ